MQILRMIAPIIILVTYRPQISSRIETLNTWMLNWKHPNTVWVKFKVELLSCWRARCQWVLCSFLQMEFFVAGMSLSATRSGVTAPSRCCESLGWTLGCRTWWGHVRAPLEVAGGQWRVNIRGDQAPGVKRPCTENNSGITPKQSEVHPPKPKCLDGGCLETVKVVSRAMDQINNNGKLTRESERVLFGQNAIEIFMSDKIVSRIIRKKVGGRHFSNTLFVLAVKRGFTDSI